jgi:Xaa-Pro aminopeptidase
VRSRTTPALAQRLGCEVRALEDVADVLDPRRACTLPAVDALTRETQARLLGRAITPRVLEGDDARLADAMIALRLHHDADAIRGLRAAAHATARAHLAGMKATHAGLREWHVRAAMIGALAHEHCGLAYETIVTQHGEVLHNHAHERRRSPPHDLVLARRRRGDAGARLGWRRHAHLAGERAASRPRQRAALRGRPGRAGSAAIDEGEAVGTRYRRRAHRGVPRARRRAPVRCSASSEATTPASARRESGAHALFFPHGVGHLLGLDVHDMEAFGDRDRLRARGRAQQPVRHSSTSASTSTSSRAWLHDRAGHLLRAGDPARRRVPRALRGAGSTSIAPSAG